MGRPLTMTRTEKTSEDFRGAASKSRDAGQLRRLLALAFVLDGQPRTETARKTGVWIARRRAACAAIRAGGKETAKLAGWYNSEPSLESVREQFMIFQRIVVIGRPGALPLDPAKGGGPWNQY